MEKEELNNQDALPVPSVHNTIKEEEADQSLRKPPQGSSAGGGSGSGGDRLKRDEWSEGAVSSLLDAYESKWVLRNRAKLKGHDWEDVARYVSSRANSTKSPKTQTQCKNKIESMKKRYRSESAATTADASSSWPLFHRLDLLLRCRTNNPSATTTAATTITSTSNQPPMAVLLDHHQAPIQLLTPPVAVAAPPSATATPPPPPPPPPTLPPPTSIGIHQNSHESNGVDLASKEDRVGTKTFEDGSDRVSMEMDSSTPMSETVKDKLKRNKEIRVEKSNKIRSRGKKKGRRIRDNHELELASSIRWLAEVMARSEQARMDMIREVEKMRVEAEAKRGEMDLKRTEIIANTQLQIAQILAGNNNAKSNIDSSLRIGRNL